MRYLAFVVALAGCTSINEMREAEPRATYESNRSVAAVSQCIAIEVRGHGQPSIIPGENNVLISYDPSGANTVLLIDIQKAGDGSQITVRQKLGYLSKNAVERCI